MAYFNNTTCCGLVELANVGDSGRLIKQPIKELRKGGIFATTNQRQDRARARLIRLKFKPLTTFINPRTKNTITLWFKAINQPRKKKA